MARPTFSIILPIYNQQDHIKYLVKTYRKSLESLRESYEVILVVNRSDDNSYQFACSITNTEPRFKVYQLKKGSWGRAVNFGLKKAQGKFICYTNSTRTDVEDLTRMLKLAQVNNNTVLKATRIARENMFRKLGSILYNLECRLFFKIPIWDINGTPKIIPHHLLKKIHLKSKNDLIDLELMINCIKKKIPIIEVPVNFNRRITGKSTTNIISAIKLYLGAINLKYS